uniref:DUF4201 domain-containing protein n=1 Tax=Mesocestoides corti TaxID=53468 RepID=A0A5K3EMI6_MESCO
MGLLLNKSQNLKKKKWNYPCQQFNSSIFIALSCQSGLHCIQSVCLVYEFLVKLSMTLLSASKLLKLQN